MISIDTGDTVFHRPTRETWLVAYVRDNRLAWIGWPFGESYVSDCLLVNKATLQKRCHLLHSMASIRNSSDPRSIYARATLEKTT